jgi:hypothetical protein
MNMITWTGKWGQDSRSRAAGDDGRDITARTEERKGWPVHVSKDRKLRQDNRRPDFHGRAAIIGQPGQDCQNTTARTWVVDQQGQQSPGSVV